MPLPPAWGRFLADWPRGARLALLVAFVVIVGWLFALPSPFFQRFPAAVWLEGPVPAWIGAAVGLRQAHALPGWQQGLRAAAYASLALFLAALVLGPFFSGLVPAFWGVVGLFRILSGNAFVVLSDSRVWGLNLSWALWVGVKTLLLWGGIGYGVLLFVQRDGKAKLRDWWSQQGDRRAFTREQRAQMAEYQKLYMAARRAGQPVPPAPAGLMVGAPGVSWGDRAKLTFWAVRIGLLLVGAFGLWALFGGYATAIARELVWRLFMG